MIEQYLYVLDYGLTPSCLIPPLVSTGSVVGSEGTFIPPIPSLKRMRSMGSQQAVQEFRDTHG